MSNLSNPCIWNSHLSKQSLSVMVGLLSNLYYETRNSQHRAHHDETWKRPVLVCIEFDLDNFINHFWTAWPPIGPDQACYFGYLDLIRYKSFSMYTGYSLYVRFSGLSYMLVFVALGCLVRVTDVAGLFYCRLSWWNSYIFLHLYA